MRVIDAHAHIMQSVRGVRLGDVPTCGVGYGRVAVGSTVEQWMPPSFERSAASLDVLIAYHDYLEIGGAVLLQAPCYGDQLPYLRAAVRAYPGRFVAMALVDPRDSGGAPEYIYRIATHPEVVGVKLEIPDMPFYMDEPQHLALWRAIAEMGLLVTIDLGWHDGPYDGHVDRLMRVLEVHPTLQVVVAHLGVSRLWDPEEAPPFAHLQRTLEQLSPFPTVWFDLAALPFFCPGEEYPYSRAQQIMDVALQQVSPERLMWGSDFPTVLQHCTYRQALDLVRLHFTGLTASDMGSVLGDTAHHVYRFAKVGSMLADHTSPALRGGVSGK